MRFRPLLKKLRVVLPILAACIAGRSAVAQEVRASVSSRTVYQGESFIYQLRVSGVKQPVPQVPQVKSVRFESLGTPTLQQSITIINNRRSQATILTFSWRATPLEAGQLTIPAATVKSGDETIKSQPISIKVVAPSVSELFSLSARVDRKRIYPGQKFGVELSVDMRRLPEPFSDVSPVSSQVLRSQPGLRVPWFEDSRIPSGLAAAGPLDTRRWQTRNGSGFTLNGMRQFGFLTMLPEPESVGEDDGQPRLRYTFNRQFVAERAGRFELGIASLRGALVSTIRDNQATLEDVFGVTDALVVNVDPLPLDSRPDSWIGVIGDLDVRAEITPRAGRVGEPMTLTLSLEGEGALADAFPPKLAENEGITSRFRTYEPTSRLNSSSRVFTFSIRPRVSGSITFPPIELTWFDPLREEYVTGRTSEIPLDIAEGNGIVGNGTQSSGTTPAPQSEVLVATEGGISANLMHLTNDRIHPRQWFIAWGAIAAVTAVLCLMTGRKTSRRVRLARVRDKRLASSGSELSSAISQLQSGDRNAGITGIRTAVNRIVAAAINSADEGLTTAEVGKHLRQAGFESDLVAATEALLEDCDAARYGAAREGLEDLGSAARGTVGDLLNAAKRMRFDG